MSRAPSISVHKNYHCRNLRLRIVRLDEISLIIRNEILFDRHWIWCLDASSFRLVDSNVQH